MISLFFREFVDLFKNNEQEKATSKRVRESIECWLGKASQRCYPTKTVSVKGICMF